MCLQDRNSTTDRREVNAEDTGGRDEETGEPGDSTWTLTQTALLVSFLSTVITSSSCLASSVRFLLITTEISICNFFRSVRCNL